MANKFISGTLILTLSGFVVKAIGSINWIILSRILGGEGIGIYQMAFPIYLLALDISSAGLPIAISIITAEKVAKQDYFGAQRIFHVSLSMLCTTALFLSILMFFGSSFLIDEHIIRESRAYYSLIALAPAIFFTTIIAGYRGYLQGWQQMTPTAISQIGEQLVRVVVMLGFAALLLPYGLDYAAGGASLGAGAGGFAAWLVLVYYYYKLKRSLPVGGPTFEQESIKHILKRLVILAIPISLSSIMLPVVSNLDLLIVPRRLEVAGYSTHQATELFGYLTGMSVPLINLATILTAAMAMSLVPAISHSFTLKEYDEIRERTATSMRISFLVTIPFSVILYVMAEPIVTCTGRDGSDAGCGHRHLLPGAAPDFDGHPPGAEEAEDPGHQHGCRLCRQGPVQLVPGRHPDLGHHRGFLCDGGRHRRRRRPQHVLHLP